MPFPFFYFHLLRVLSSWQEKEGKTLKKRNTYSCRSFFLSLLCGRDLHLRLFVTPRMKSLRIGLWDFSFSLLLFLEEEAVGENASHFRARRNPPKASFSPLLLQSVLHSQAHTHTHTQTKQGSQAKKAKKPKPNNGSGAVKRKEEPTAGGGREVEETKR